jgi:hypothetical protein
VDISQEALTLSATWILGEYSEILIEGGLVDEDQTKTVGGNDDSFNNFLKSFVGI